MQTTLGKPREGVWSPDGRAQIGTPNGPLTSPGQGLSELTNPMTPVGHTRELEGSNRCARRVATTVT